jgi:hypothetical protein
VQIASPINGKKEMAKAPWASGPGEILQHGLSLLRKDTDAHRRLAMLSIDNAVELMIKTFLGLPKRVTGLTISRSRYDEFSESFPKLLDALQEFASDRAGGIDLGEIEWYHRLRNQLYHEGNGLTVEREKVRVYAELAKVLFNNLFGHDIDVTEGSDEDLLGPFLRAWAELESALMKAWDRLNLSESERLHLLMTPGQLAERGLLEKAVVKDIGHLRSVRNQWVHGHSDGKWTQKITPDMIDRLKEIVTRIKAIPAN